MNPVYTDAPPRYTDKSCAYLQSQALFWIPTEGKRPDFTSFGSRDDRAISQRIKAPQQRAGELLVRHEKLCTATPAGVLLLRLAAQVALIESFKLTVTAHGSVGRSTNEPRPADPGICPE